LVPLALRADTYDGRTLVAVTASSPQEVRALYDLRADIVGRSGDVYKILLTAEEMDALKASGLGFEVLAAEMARDRALFANPGRCPQPGGAPCYYTASKFNTTAPPSGSLMEHLLQLHNAHPEITRLFDIGNSADGAYDIIAMQVSKNPDAAEPEPKIRIYGNIHGDEVGGLMVAVDSLDWILGNYLVDVRATSLVDGADLWYIPMGNPWGNAHSTRYNSHSKDLNRNFSGPVGCDAPPCFSESETQAIRDLTEVMGKRFAISLSFHGGAICFNSVYNYTSTATTDEPIFFSSRTGGPQNDAVPSPDGLAEAYRQGCTTPGFWYTNGADWYITHGDTNDWSYSVWSDLDTTIEVSAVKWPDSSQIPVVQGQHRQAVINYMLKVFQGISGVVRDAGTLAPLNAKVKATATASPTIPVPHPYLEVPTDPAVGDYHRILAPGTYSVTCSAPGYPSQTVHGIVVTADSTTAVDFALGSVPLAATATASPSEGVAPLAVTFGAAPSGGTSPYTFAWSFGDGAASSQQNPSHTFSQPGIYHPALTVYDSAGGSASDTHLTVTVAASPCALSCTASVPPSAVAGEMVSFSALAQTQNCSGTLSYTWDFGDGTSSSQKNSGHVYAAAGDYTWTLQVRISTVVCTKTGTIHVAPACSVSCTASANPSSGTAPLTVQFAGTATPDHCSGSPSFAWSFGDSAASSQENPSHTYFSPGTYTWTLAVSLGGKSCSKTGAVTVVEPCSLDCSALASPAGGSDPFLVHFAASAEANHCASAATFSWNFGDGTTSTDPSPDHLYPGPGSYTWTLVVSAGDQTCPKSGTITLAAPCTLVCEASATPSSGTVPLLVAFVATARPDHCDGAPSFAWTFGDSGFSTEQTPSHLYEAAGSYAWTLTVTSGGVTCTRTGSILVGEPPCTLTCDATAEPSSGFSPLTVAFSASITAVHCAGEPSFAWTFGDGAIASGPAPYHLYPVPGTYAWSLDVTQGGFSCGRTGTVTIAQGLPGDADGNGVVSIGEVQQAINMFLGTQPPGNGVDCDGDGSVSIGEVQRVINAFLGLPSSC
jgi:PKD repeat protein